MRQAIFILFMCCSLYTHAVTDTLRWQRLSPLPSFPRASFQSFLIDSDFYVVGGIDTNILFVREVWRYHVPSDDWTRMHDFPFGYPAQGQGFSLYGKGYICGGYVTDSLIHMPSGNNGLWKYEPDSDRWQIQTSKPGVKVYYQSAIADKEYAYVTVGISFNDPPPHEFWRYDPVSNNWTALDTFPGTGRFSAGMSMVKSSIYLMCGDTGNTTVKDVWTYDTITKNWNYLCDIPGNSRRFPLTYSLDSFFLTGYGISFLHPQNESDFYRYYPDRNIWDTVINLNFVDSNKVLDRTPEPAGSFIIGRQAYSMGVIGLGKTFYNNAYTTDLTGLYRSLYTGIDEPAGAASYHFTLYPNPIGAEGTFRLESSEDGEISFYTVLGQLLYTAKIKAGVTVFNCYDLHCETNLVTYRATLRSSKTENGKIVILK
jgi:N-acetylneuraminic acid mutarotase